ncbi:MAG TPA: class I SAM-dependent methyltransferase [Terrimicrobiaceae bacterium]
MSDRSLSQLRWALAFLADNKTVRSKRFGIPPEAKSVRYPIRLLRYWFGYHLLREEAERCPRPLEIAEIGVHTGQMLEFFRSVPAHPVFARWTAVDAVMLTEKLRKAGYDDFFEANLEDPGFDLPASYDVAVLLHILEHLMEPESALQKIARRIRPGGSLIGGFPVVPGPLARLRESQVRKTAAPMGHVSVFSPGRVREMAAICGLQLEFSSGAFFVRSKGSWLENSMLWARFNLLWGAAFPGWPGEIYWLMRKPQTASDLSN